MLSLCQPLLFQKSHLILEMLRSVPALKPAAPSSFSICFGHLSEWPTWLRIPTGSKAPRGWWISSLPVRGRAMSDGDCAPPDRDFPGEVLLPESGHERATIWWKLCSRNSRTRSACAVCAYGG